MDLRDIIFSKLSKLSKTEQDEVINFIEFLDSKNVDVQISTEDSDWSNFSLSHAMKGMEDEEDLYTIDDIKIKYL